MIVAVIDFVRLAAFGGRESLVLSGWAVTPTTEPPDICLVTTGVRQEMLGPVSYYRRPDVDAGPGRVTHGFEIGPLSDAVVSELLHGTSCLEIHSGECSTLAAISELATSQLEDLVNILNLGPTELLDHVVPAIEMLPNFHEPSMEARRERALETTLNNALLSMKDKRLLESALRNYDQRLIAEMSIFIDWSRHLRGRIYRVEHVAGQESFYLSRALLPKDVGGLFVDASRRICLTSRYFMHDPISLAEFLPSVLEAVYSVDLHGAVELPSGVIGTEKWHHSYGHLHDELYTVASARQRLDPSAERIPLIDHVVSGSVQDWPLVRNLRQMSMLIAPVGTINAQDFGPVPLKLGDVVLVGNRLTYPTFHEFQHSISDGVVAKVIGAAGPVSYGGCVFVTRGPSTGLPRNIANQKEIEEVLAQMGFDVFNPESSDFVGMVTCLSAAADLVITWGSALTNLAYARAGARVCILQSDSYQNESFEILFSRIANARQLRITILATISNEIDTDRLVAWVQNREGVRR